MQTVLADGIYNPSPVIGPAITIQTSQIQMDALILPLHNAATIYSKATCSHYLASVTA